MPSVPTTNCGHNHGIECIRHNWRLKWRENPVAEKQTMKKNQKNEVTFRADYSPDLPLAVELRDVLAQQDVARQDAERKTNSVKAHIVNMLGDGWNKAEVEAAAAYVPDNASEADKATAKRFVQYAREIISRLSNDDREELAKANDVAPEKLEQEIGVKGTKKETKPTMSKGQLAIEDAWVKLGSSLMMAGEYIACPKWLQPFVSHEEWNKETAQTQDRKRSQGLDQKAVSAIIQKYTRNATRGVNEKLSETAKQLREIAATEAKVKQAADRIDAATAGVPLKNLVATAKDLGISIPKASKANKRQVVINQLMTSERLLAEFEKPSQSGIAINWKAAAKADVARAIAATKKAS